MTAPCSPTRLRGRPTRSPWPACAAGAVIFGKHQSDELAAHVSGSRTSCFGPMVNPWHPERRLSPGGSSRDRSGVAAGYCPEARTPAAPSGSRRAGAQRHPLTQGKAISPDSPPAAKLDTVGGNGPFRLGHRPSAPDPRRSSPARHIAGVRPHPVPPPSAFSPELVRAKGSPEVIEAYAEAVGRWGRVRECIPSACRCWTIPPWWIR